MEISKETIQLLQEGLPCAPMQGFEAVVLKRDLINRIESLAGQDQVDASVFSKHDLKFLIQALNTIPITPTKEAEDYFIAGVTELKNLLEK